MLEDQLKTLQQLDQSVVRLEMLGEHGMPISIGTGFSTREGELLTNAHVLLGTARATGSRC